MKVYSIGREVGCDIIINDNSDVISRRHATLNVTSSGKMTIVDLSHNGTYVNGIRIAQNVPVPVTRKDNVSFAHVARLDWNLIPNTTGQIVKWAIIGVVALLLIIGGVWGFSALTKGGSGSSDDGPVPAAVDSTTLKMEKEKMEEQEKQKQDSLKKHVQDSLTKVYQKNVGKVPAKKNDSKKAEPKKTEPKKSEPKEESNTNRKRG
ncbi:MAG: FHA domain-containing protein [Prevotella sp.]|nr:FHA domain-containing protein [Prevotella sp.]